jgi:hypothetical protein
MLSSSRFVMKKILMVFFSWNAFDKKKDEFITEITKNKDIVRL